MTNYDKLKPYSYLVAKKNKTLQQSKSFWKQKRINFNIRIQYFNLLPKFILEKN